MIAVLWIHEKKCRVLMKDGDGRVFDTDDTWNNRASAENMVIQSFPKARIRFVKDQSEVRDLNAEWDACVLGA